MKCMQRQKINTITNIRVSILINTMIIKLTKMMTYLQTLFLFKLYPNNSIKHSKIF